MKEKQNVLGIDAGSISVSVVTLASDRSVVQSAYAFHKGDVAGTLKHLLESCDLASIRGVAVTSAAQGVVKVAAVCDSRIAIITAARHFHGNPGAILSVGGEKFGLFLFDENGEYLNYRSNTSCAAGTGSFLDQQAARLSLSGIEEFCGLAFENKGAVPKIASRCAVFAKTDLIHAQQEGFSIEEICDGLSSGMVKTIVDTLFSNVKVRPPVVFCGGVSRNRAVAKHLTAALGVEVTSDSYSHLYGAIGAALHLLESGDFDESFEIRTADDIVCQLEKQRDYFYPPLTLTLSTYPAFDSAERYEYRPRRDDFAVPVEVDVYEPLAAGAACRVYLGIDIGSTSTKAVLLDEQKRVIAGFYTRTSGRPVAAVQAIFECIEDVAASRGIDLAFLGVGTTGSGRKFVGGVIGADLALDEITAHARAAYEIYPAVDTIIEIGGQDSKFTTLRNGSVTFSVMNQVCAAGTGSFIEEQAKKLGCPLDDFARRAEGKPAPLSSDRCTVFMERDLNRFLSEGYDVDEVLASVLHSVRDNYLTKVAVEKNIGARVLFQGATAKNRALVAAFEQRLKRPIIVSKFCHLTGAMGVALCLHDEGRVATSFRGIGLHKERIPVRIEVCELCANHCKITVASVMGDTVAFGFLCGRDYDTGRYVKEDTAFDLFKIRNSVLFDHSSARNQGVVTVGIPAALHLYDELPLWKNFFDRLGVATITSEGYRSGIADGKKVAGAEFCAPIAALHGHVNWLADRADHVFLPYYMEVRSDDRNIKRNYCYYTQYAPAVVLSAVDIRHKEKIHIPLIRSNLGTLYTKMQLYRAVRKIIGPSVGFMQVSAAYDAALDHFSRARAKLRDIFLKETSQADDISVVFLGRPYTVMSRAMNNGIPSIVAKHGIKTFFHDMVPHEEQPEASIRELLTAVHWRYAADILASARAIADMKGVYPIFVTSFKCTPDAYVMEFFKRIMESRRKPYLILQLDEHDSSVGYETRIEAALRSFRNHFRSPEDAHNGVRIINDAGFTKDSGVFAGKTLLLPNWDQITCGLLEAVLRREGIDARIVSESHDSIKRSMRFNTGQCIPLNIIIQNSIDYIERHGLDPERTVIWSPNSKIACNIGMFPYYTKYVLESCGKAFQSIPVFVGDITFVDISIRTAVNAYLAYLFGGMIRRMGCAVRPYEQIPGAADAAVAEASAILYDAFLNDRDREEAIERTVTLFQAIPTVRTRRPQVAIFGDLYVRDNDVLNQNLIKTIEENGGEVVTTPYSELITIVADRYIRKWFMQGLYGDAALGKVLSKVVAVLNQKYYPYFARVVPACDYRAPRDAGGLISRFGLSVYHTGESMENLLKIFHLIERYPDLSLFVQTNPSYCCPSLVTEAMADRIEQITGIPIVTIEYDGTGGSKNEDVIPYLKYPRRKREGRFSPGTDKGSFTSVSA